MDLIYGYLLFALSVLWAFSIEERLEARRRRRSIDVTSSLPAAYLRRRR